MVDVVVEVGVVDVVVEVGGWEHECCGAAVERNQLVDLRCIRCTAPDGDVHLVESHHEVDVPAGERVQGRVTDVQVVPGGHRVRTVAGPRPPTGPSAVDRAARSALATPAAG